ncbi:MAG: archease [Acidimicrobiales bacterium]
MTLESDGSFKDLASNHPLAVEVAGPTMEACLARAVEAFAEAVADVHPSMEASTRPLRIAWSSTPSALLLAVLEECLRRGREGEVAVGLLDAAVEDGHLQGALQTVPASDPRLRARPRRVVSWHEVSLDRDGDDGWRGRIVAR